MTNVGKWDHGTEVHRYGRDDESYIKAASFLDDGPVEDWGCGGGWAKQFFTSYTGIDGSKGQADVIADLTAYRSRTSGILLRHVLEHDYKWEAILRNALASCEKLVIVTFTPFSSKTRQMSFSDRTNVPTLSFKKDDLTKHFKGWTWTEETIGDNTEGHFPETIFYLTKDKR